MRNHPGFQGKFFLFVKIAHFTNAEIKEKKDVVLFVRSIIKFQC